MNTRRFRVLILIPTILLLLLAGGCRRGGEAVTQDQVSDMAESALIGLNNDDYDAWTEHFGSMMKAAVPREVFKTVREGVLAAVGPFQSVASVTSEPAQTEGYTRWIVTGNFENGQLRLIYVIASDGDRIDGVTFEEVS